LKISGVDSFSADAGLSGNLFCGYSGREKGNIVAFVPENDDFIGHIFIGSKNVSEKAFQGLANRISTTTIDSTRTLGPEVFAISLNQR
jgi:hypothetical protein